MEVRTLQLVLKIQHKKVIIINIIIIVLLAGFVVMSLVFYYLIPIGKNIIEIVDLAITELMKLFR